MKRDFNKSMASQLKPEKREEFILKLEKYNKTIKEADDLKDELEGMLMNEAEKKEHNFQVLPFTRIGDSHMLEEVSCSPEYLFALFPELLDSDLEYTVLSMSDTEEKYSDEIVVSPKSDPNEIYSIYAKYGELRIGGSKKGPHFDELCNLLNV